MTEQESLVGVVSISLVAKGSKSEQTTTVLVTDDRTWLLRRTEGPPFGLDPELAALDGKSVRVTGYAGSSVFVASAITVD